ncbi:hypothetical protein CYLTODRAFT_448795 [Cylindrobasidium torrendii FP15055 ss-10]|uniref:GDP-fucose protein O-fucosyltransferase 2 n=1 Tax=Cylindrobasidium torrendii FP15055 ss-10 TaxID=1314674 RepID=A0A0D7BT83_9AGAR|nr:hypothetical protein CYLTODRAFT_448795 [Cylindrobasidium torrendii FP15055 ss-10]
MPGTGFQYTLIPLASPSPRSDPEEKYRRPSLLRRARTWIIISAVAAFLFLSGRWTYLSLSANASSTSTLSPSSAASASPSLDVLTSLAPAPHFRDALRKDVKYITSWPSAGWTNDVMTMFNLIYLGVISERVPILPAFTPTHVLQDGEADHVPFGQVFDLDRMQREMSQTILEWHQVKDFAHRPEVDELGCWNVWQVSQADEKFPRKSTAPLNYLLDLSYTLAPDWVKIVPWSSSEAVNDRHTSFWALARLGFPETRNSLNLEPALPSPLHNATLEPDDHLMCLDYLYYVSAHRGDEFDWDYSPMWRFAGRYARFTPEITKLAQIYVNRAVGLPDDAPTPPYISVHIRRNDFRGWCAEDVRIDECLAPVEAYARRIEQVKSELRQKGLEVEHVVVTSDEKDKDWWADIFSRGYVSIDHSDTFKLYGVWYPVFIDAAIQGNGAGFVGTDRSTMSRLAARRVEYWHKGPFKLVKWGHLGADNEE